MSYLCLDIENDSSNKFGQKVGNFLYDPIVAIGLKNSQELKTQYIYPNKIREFQIDEDVIVGHNLSHDLLFLWYLEDLQDFFKRGGQIWDTQYAEYCLTGQQTKYASLRELAVTKYKCSNRIKYIDVLLFNKEKTLTELACLNIKHLETIYYNIDIKMIESYKKVSDLPKELVLEDVGNDVQDTEIIYLEQLQEAEKLGMTHLIKLSMDSILATIEMKFNGMKIDKTILQKNKIELNHQLQIEYNKLEFYLNKYWKV